MTRYFYPTFTVITGISYCQIEWRLRDSIYLPLNSSSNMVQSSKEALVLREIACALDRPVHAIDVNNCLLENGATSITLIRLHYALKSVGVNLTLDVLISGINVARLVEKANEQCSIPPDASVRTLTPKRMADASINPGNKKFCSPKIVGFRPPDSENTLRYPMTEMQLALLQSSIDTPNAGFISYHETHSTCNIPDLKEAWRKVISCAPLLNSTYTLEGSNGFIIEHHDKSIDWLETTVLDTEAFNAAVRREDSCHRSFGNSFRVITLLPKDGVVGKSRVIWHVHHSLIDGYSHKQLLSRLEKASMGLLLDPPISYSHFVAGLRKLQEDSRKNALDYWAVQRSKFNDIPRRFLLPDPLNPDSAKGFSGTITKKISGRCHALFCQNIGVTLPTLYHAAWALALARYMDSYIVRFGTVFSGRALPISASQLVIGMSFILQFLHV